MLDRQDCVVVVIVVIVVVPYVAASDWTADGEN
jgi:hypothetical protein